MKQKTVNGKNKALLLVALISFAVYINSFGNRFAFDDKFIIEQNPAIRSLANPGRFFTGGYWPTLASMEEGEGINKGLYRPLTILSYAVDYGIWKLNPFGYHVLNVLSHALNAALIFLVLSSLLSGFKGAPSLALFAALIFAVHPVNTEAVTGIVGRADTLSTSFALGAILFHVSAKRRPFVSCLFFLAALLTKEMAITLPALVILCDACFGKRGVKSNLKYYALYFMTALVYLMLRYSVLGAMGPSAAKQVLQNASATERFLTMAKVFARYLKLFFYPVDLYIDYNSSFSYVLSLAEPYALISLLILVSYAPALVLAWKKSRTAFFSLAWFLVALLPVSHIMPIGAILAERFLYLPSAGFCLLLALMLKEAGGKKTAVPVILLALILALFSARTLERNADWHSDYTLWRRAIRTAPDNSRSYYDFGTAALKEGRYDEAIDAFWKSIEKGTDIADFDKKHYALLPSEFMHRVYNNLGIACYNKKDYGGAIDAFRKAVEVKPSYAAAYNNMGNACMENSMPNEAMESYKKCIEIDPAIADGYYNLGLVYERTQNYDEALRQFQSALSRDPRNVNSIFMTGVVYYDKGMYDKAAEWFKKTLEVKPDFTAARTNYEIMLQKLKKNE